MISTNEQQGHTERRGAVFFIKLLNVFLETKLQISLELMIGLSETTGTCIHEGYNTLARPST